MYRDGDQGEHPSDKVLKCGENKCCVLMKCLRSSADTEQRENEAIQQVREAITMAETSVLEKDQVGHMICMTWIDDSDLYDLD